MYVIIMFRAKFYILIAIIIITCNDSKSKKNNEKLSIRCGD